MLEDKMREYEKNKKRLKNTPARYKKEYPWLKEVDSLALAQESEERFSEIQIKTQKQEKLYHKCGKWKHQTGKRKITG